MLRVGEATHPGPMPVPGWQFGLCNPSGLNSKTDHVAAMQGDIWVVSETQLSKLGFSKFQQGLKALKSPWKYVVPGAACPERGPTATGTHSGVMLLSQHPARALPHSFDVDMYASARVQVAGVVLHGVWVTVGMLYGVPCNANHKQAKFQTECMLDSLVDRVACQSCGPRIIAGDFNYAVEELSQLNRLRELGFREVQDVAAHQWGQHVSRTGRGAKRIDQVWISPELQTVLLSVQVQFDHWADHAAVISTFKPLGAQAQFDEWYVPAPFPWPSCWQSDVQWCALSDMTTAYAKLWDHLESQARSHHVLHGGRISPVQCGRGQTLNTRPKSYRLTPCRKGRYGEVQPTYMGVSLQHARYFKQLRRLQALMQQLRVEDASSSARDNSVCTWRAIRMAVGFPGGFGPWWLQHQLLPVLPAVLPLHHPGADIVAQMFVSFRAFVQKFESQLAQARYRYGKAKRAHTLNYVFQDCKAAPLPQADTLLDRVEVGVDEVREEDHSIVLTEPVQLIPDIPVVAGGRVLEVLHHEHDQVWVSSLEGVGPGMMLTQERAVMDDRSILLRFKELWQPRWNKLSHVAEGQWTQICDFVRHHFRPIEWHWSPWTAERFVKAVGKKKVKAAKGADGVSQPDLAALPPQACAAFVNLFEAVEQGKGWPLQLSTGFVTSLAKHESAQKEDEFRPVTVYGLVYRLWSSEQAQEALQSLRHVVPQSVQGGLPARQAKAIWYAVAQALEAAYVDNQPLHGLLMDIQKCFNALPRLPLWCALEQLQFPLSTLRGWVSFVSAQTRRFRVRQSVGEPIPSVCGMPEGCALSVFAMVIVDWMLDLWLRQLDVAPTLQTFIDDWSVLFTSHLDFPRIWSLILDFTACMDLTLDLHKTRVWSTTAEARSAFRAGTLDVAHVARLLGAHQNYTRHAWNSTLQKRLDSMPAVWTKLRASLSPYKYKHVALRMLGWPKAFHACSVVHIGQCHFQKVRSGAMRGLKAERKGANPALHLIISHLLGDPEAWVIVQTIRDARDLGGLDRVEQFLALFAHSTEDLPSNGPTSVLKSRLDRLGWVIGGNGLVQDRLGSFSLLSTGWDELYLRVQLSWGHVLHAEVGHRQSFAGIARADLGELHRALRGFGDLDLALLRCYLDGTLYTQNGRAKFQQGVTAQCPWCQQRDGFFHRAWTCAHFADCRSHVSAEQRAAIDGLPECLSVHGWPVVLSEWEVLASYFLSESGVCRESPVHPVKSGEAIQVDLFVDGTAAHPTEPKLRYAAWAITWATGGPGSLLHEVLHGGHVVGLIQSAFRAELTAVVMALRWAVQHGVSVRIWSDCLSVVRGVRRLQRGLGVRPNSSHTDLWLQVMDLLQEIGSDRVCMVKVVSHCAPTCAQDPVEEWAYWHNQLVDQAASVVNERRSEGFWIAWRGLADALQFHRKLHHAILQVLLRTARKSVQEKKPDYAYRQVVETVEPPAMPLPDTWVLPSKMFLRHGQANVEAVHSWWQQIGRVVMGGDGQLTYVSGLQLFLDFYLETKHAGPWVFRKKWYTNADAVPARGVQAWGARVKAFLSLLQVYLKANQVSLTKKMTRPTSSAISTWLVCYRLRYPVARLRKLDDEIYRVAGRQLVSGSDIASFSPLQAD
eukprot:s775_g17.t1